MAFQSQRRRLLAAGAASAAWLVAPAARANGWPTRPVTFLQPYGPGTNLDAITRFVAERLGPQWKVPIVVENKAGANGVIGTDYVARSTPDGYTFLFTGPGHYTNQALMNSVPFDPVKDFRPVARLASVMLVLVVPRRSPFQSVQDLVEHARNNPGKLSYASAGSGSAQHLSAALFLASAGINVLHVPYKTQPQALMDTIGGRVDFTFSALTTAAAQIKAGNVRALAVTGPRRSVSLPDLPTVAELGFPGYEFFSFNAVFAPAAAPDEAVQKLSDGLSAIARSPEYAQLARQQGFETDFADMREWGAALPAERKKWLEMIRISGARLE
ncbi:tripartite tricarboxylate transporter substrate binding protein [Bordetella sp. BOR01]|uniref:tripartite tricarboxylate transporter substrate binding protein n=1 Tax=Bordetella sp. BOR01 TaxID=2854779 RepID=UPI001C470FCA|nr:tripartite tricarboxylate transporter substrate binding protein [Bordetella sp. BOR01]MBV7482620.1 tripartite tricarboxylate transporter substrate binding protein [Bordetella sp. BOR01]